MNVQSKTRGQLVSKLQHLKNNPYIELNKNDINQICDYLLEDKWIIKKLEGISDLNEMLINKLLKENKNLYDKINGWKNTEDSNCKDCIYYKKLYTPPTLNQEAIYGHCCTLFLREGEVMFLDNDEGSCEEYINKEWRNNYDK